MKAFDRICRTRNGELVRFSRLRDPIAEFVYEGRLVRTAELNLWQEDGSWRALPGEPGHPLDLILSTSK